jgi:hypothetical protein
MMRKLLGLIISSMLIELALSSNGACSFFCNQNYIGVGRGRCMSDAARGLGDCFKCGPKSDQNLQVCSKETIQAHCCSATTPNCCGSTCVNFLTDSQNCGSCGNVCQNSQCSNGHCQTDVTCLHNYFIAWTSFDNPINKSSELLALNPFNSLIYNDGLYVFSGGYNGVIVQILAVDPCLKPYYQNLKQFILNSYSFNDDVTPTPQVECHDTDYMCNVYGGSYGFQSDCLSPTVPKSCWLGIFMSTEATFPFLA